MIEMKKSIITVCTLLCLCLAACVEQGADVPTSSEISENQVTIPQQVTDVAEQTTITIEESDVPALDPSTPSKERGLRVSDEVYTLSSSSEPDSSCIDEDLIPFYKDAFNCAILVPLVGMEALQEYGAYLLNTLSYQEQMNIPELHYNIHHFGISLEELLESPYGGRYDRDILHAMYLPYEEMLAVTMRPQAAYLNGNVYNIQTLNELFRDDKEEFARFSLDDLIDYQERLEENGIFYGFNQDMVAFAIQNNK